MIIGRSMQIGPPPAGHEEFGVRFAEPVEDDLRIGGIVFPPPQGAVGPQPAFFRRAEREVKDPGFHQAAISCWEEDLTCAPRILQHEPQEEVFGAEDSQIGPFRVQSAVDVGHRKVVISFYRLVESFYLLRRHILLLNADEVFSVEVMQG